MSLKMRVVTNGDKYRLEALVWHDPVLCVVYRERPWYSRLFPWWKPRWTLYVHRDILFCSFLGEGEGSPVEFATYEEAAERAEKIRAKLEEYAKEYRPVEKCPVCKRPQRACECAGEAV